MKRRGSILSEYGSRHRDSNHDNERELAILRQ